MCINNSIYTWDAKFHPDKAFEGAMVDKFEITSCKYLGIIFIKIIGYTSLGNSWIAILILSGAMEPCINSSGSRKGSIIPETFPKAKSKSQQFVKEDAGPWPAIFKTKWKYFTVKVLRLPIDPQNFSTSNDLQYTVLLWETLKVCYYPENH